jgi:DNA-binding response OmpR family regulator
MPSPVPSNNEKILIITADGNFGERLSQALEQEGYSVDTEKDGEKGLQKIYDTMPHLTLLDVTVTGADSYDLLAKKNSELLLSKLPLFLMSTQGMPINIGKVPQGSVTEFIVAMNANVADIVSKVNKQFKREKAKENTPVAATGKTILWVEDDKLIGTILGKKLISSGFNLIHTKNGEDALAELEKTKPDAIIVDLLLPGMSGFDILQKIRSNDQNKKIPVMILSNLSKPTDIEKARTLGAQRFLVKATASLDQIVSEISELCRIGK